MRTFKIGHGEARKVVILEVQGARLRVARKAADGTIERSKMDLAGEAEALAACERMALELTAGGYAERDAPAPAGVEPARSARSSSSRSKKSARSASPGGLDLGLLAEAGEEDSERVESVLPRVAPSPAAEASPGKKPGGQKKKKKRKGGEGQADDLDKRVIAGIALFGLLCVGCLGYLAYAAFLKPASIVGHWEGSRTEHEIGKYLTNTQYRLILDEKKNVSMSVQEETASVGTYALQGDRLKLMLAYKFEGGDDGEEGDAGQVAPAGKVQYNEVQYKVILGGSTLDLFDAETGKKVVQLIRFHKQTAAGRGTPPPAAPKDLAGGPPDKANEDALATVAYGAKDGAFRLRHPAGWGEEDGSRSDNSYSWVRYTKGSAKIQVFADVSGSLTSGPNSGDYPEGSEMAPVHGAHERYKRAISEQYGDYKESEPATFKGSGLGEGRIASFTASGGGIFGSRLAGFRVTLLTNDRRITILCEAPPKEFEKLKPTFLATARSLGR